MITGQVEINGCKHFFLNSESKPIIFFIHSWQYVKIDYDTEHPLGIVYMPKNCLDTIIRFVIQKDNSVLLFRVNEWRTPKNIYLKKKTNYLKEFLKDIL